MPLLKRRPAARIHLQPGQGQGQGGAQHGPAASDQSHWAVAGTLVGILLQPQPSAFTTQPGALHAPTCEGQAEEGGTAPLPLGLQQAHPTGHGLKAKPMPLLLGYLLLHWGRACG